MLEVEDLHVEIGGKEVISGISFRVPERETHILFGRNGSGKTTLLHSIMGFPDYRVTRGRIAFEGKDITRLPLNERARLGFGISYQRPPSIRGLRLRDMVHICSQNGDHIDDMAAELDLADFLDRDLNLGFSGGELKRSELLQLVAQDPKFIMLDEPESGVDLESIGKVGEIIRKLLERDLQRTRKKSGMIITHTGFILDYVDADHGYVLLEGKLWCEGSPREMLRGIRECGYEGCKECRK